MTLLSKLRELKIVRYLQALSIISSNPKVYDGEQWDLHKYGCPDCKTNPFIYYEGPEGPGAVNICCTNPFCRSAFWMAYGPWDGLRRIPNTVFRRSFPEFPEESEAYLKAEIAKKLNDETSELMKPYEEAVK